MFPILGGPLRLNERAANDIFSGWTSTSRYEPPADVEKTFKIFFELKEPFGGNKSDWNHLSLLCRCCILGQICFPHMSATRQARLAGTLYTSRNFSCMVITSCMSVVVSGFGAAWLFVGNVLCNILMACCRCFWYMHQITIALQVRLRGFTLEF